MPNTFKCRKLRLNSNIYLRENLIAEIKKNIKGKKNKEHYKKNNSPKFKITQEQYFF